jgi:hypothetical protein
MNLPEGRPKAGPDPSALPGVAEALATASVWAPETRFLRETGFLVSKLYHYQALHSCVLSRRVRL